MDKNQLVELTIEDMSVEGQGIGRIVGSGESGEPSGKKSGSLSGESGGDDRGMVVFAAGAVAGDRVRARLTRIKKNYAFAQVEEILEESPLRAEDSDCPGCAQGCGGCPLGPLTYEAQLKLKENQVRSRLERIAGLEDPLIRPIAGMADEDNGGQGCFRYRNKAVFQVSTGGIITRKGGVVENLGDPAVGFYSAGSHDVVDCADCRLQSPAAMAAADALRRFMVEDNITGFDPKWEKGLMRHMIVRTAFATGEVMVILVINGKGIPGAPKLIEMLDEAVWQAGFSLESVVINIHKASGKNVEKNKNKDRRHIRVNGEIMGPENVVIAGKPTILDRVGEMDVEISPASFFQVNPVQMERLYERVREYCRPSADRPVILDLYCGVGSIGLYCADLAEMVIGIESVKDAVTDANRNAVINGIVNARFLCGRAEDVLPAYVRGEAPGMDESLQEYIRRADIAILDPPRAGCRPELLDAVAFADIPRIIYVSCDPATLARDIRILTERGYAFVEGAPVDMFPHTGHVETVALIQKRKSN